MTSIPKFQKVVNKNFYKYTLFDSSTKTSSSVFLSHASTSDAPTRLNEAEPECNPNTVHHPINKDSNYHKHLSKDVVEQFVFSTPTTPRTYTRMPDNAQELCRNVTQYFNDNYYEYKLVYEQDLRTFNEKQVEADNPKTKTKSANLVTKVNNPTIVAFMVELELFEGGEGSKANEVREGGRVYIDDINQQTWVCVTINQFPETLKKLHVIRMTLYAPTPRLARIAPTTYYNKETWQALKGWFTSRTISFLELISFATRKNWTHDSNDEYMWHPPLKDNWVPNGVLEVVNGSVTRKRSEGAWTEVSNTATTYGHYTGLWYDGIQDYIDRKYGLYNTQKPFVALTSKNECRKMCYTMSSWYVSCAPTQTPLSGGANTMTEQVKAWLNANNTRLFESTKDMAKTYIKKHDPTYLASLLSNLSNYDQQTYDSLCAILKASQANQTEQELQPTSTSKRKTNHQGKFSKETYKIPWNPRCLMALLVAVSTPIAYKSMTSTFIVDTITNNVFGSNYGLVNNAHDETLTAHTNLRRGTQATPALEIKTQEPGFDATQQEKLGTNAKVLTNVDNSKSASRKPNKLAVHAGVGTSASGQGNAKEEAKTQDLNTRVLDLDAVKQEVDQAKLPTTSGQNVQVEFNIATPKQEDSKEGEEEKIAHKGEKGEEDAKKKAEEAEEEDEAKKKADDKEAKKKADKEAKKKADKEAKKKADEEARKKADDEAKKKADEEAKKKADEEEAKKKAEEEGAKKKAGEEEDEGEVIDLDDDQAQTQTKQAKAKSGANHVVNSSDVDESLGDVQSTNLEKGHNADVHASISQETNSYIQTYAQATFGNSDYVLPTEISDSKVLLTKWAGWFEATVKEPERGNGSLEYINQVNNLLKVRTYCISTEIPYPQVLTALHNDLLAFIQQRVEAQNLAKSNNQPDVDTSVGDVVVKLNANVQVKTFLDALKQEAFGRHERDAKHVVEHLAHVAQYSDQQSMAIQLSTQALSPYFGVFGDTSRDVTIDPPEAKDILVDFLTKNQNYKDLKFCGLSEQQIETWAAIHTKVQSNAIKASRFARVTNLCRMASVMANIGEDKLLSNDYQSAGSIGGALLVILANCSEVDDTVMTQILEIELTVDKAKQTAFIEVGTAIQTYFDDVTAWVESELETTTITLPGNNHTLLVESFFSHIENSTSYCHLDVIQTFAQSTSLLTGGGLMSVMSSLGVLFQTFRNTILMSSPNVTFVCPTSEAFNIYKSSSITQPLSDVLDAYNLADTVNKLESVNCSIKPLRNLKTATTHTYEVGMKLLVLQSAINNPIVSSVIFSSEDMTNGLFNKTTDSVSSNLTKVLELLDKGPYYANNLDSLILLKPELNTLLQNAAVNGTKENINNLMDPLIEGLQSYLKDTPHDTVKANVANLSSLLSNEDFKEEKGSYENGNAAYKFRDLLDFVLSFGLWFAWNTMITVIFRVLVNFYRWFVSGKLEQSYITWFTMLVVLYVALTYMLPKQAQYAATVAYVDPPFISSSFERDFEQVIPMLTEIANSKWNIVGATTQRAKYWYNRAEETTRSLGIKLMRATQPTDKPFVPPERPMDTEGYIEAVIKAEPLVMWIVYLVSCFVGAFVSAKYPREVASGEWQAVLAALPLGVGVAHRIFTALGTISEALASTVVCAGLGTFLSLGIKSFMGNNLGNLAAVGTNFLGSSLVGLGVMAWNHLTQSTPLQELVTNNVWPMLATWLGQYLVYKHEVVMQAVSFLASIIQPTTSFKVAAFILLPSWPGLQTHVILPTELLFDASIQTIGTVMYWSGLQVDAEPVLALAKATGNSKSVKTKLGDVTLNVDRYVSRMNNDQRLVHCTIDDETETIYLLVPTIDNKGIYAFCKYNDLEYYLTYLDRAGGYSVCLYKRSPELEFVTNGITMEAVVKCVPPSDGTKQDAWTSAPPPSSSYYDKYGAAALGIP